MIRASLATIMITIGLVMCSCTHYYSLGDQVFTSRDDAEERHNEQIKHTLEGVHRTPDPVGGTALLVIPTLKALERSGILMTSGSRDDLSDNQIEYLRDFSMREYEAFYSILVKRGIFDDVVLLKSENPQKESFKGHDFLIYLFNPDPSVSGWYIKGSNWPSAQIVRMEGTDRLSRTMSWLDSIQRLALSKQKDRG